MSKRLFERLRLIIILNVCILGSGTIGDMLIEGWSLGNALYMTVITVGSVGYQEVLPLSSAGRLFTGILIALGVGTVAATFTLLVDSLFSTEIQRERVKRRMSKKLDKLNDHVIVCGFGRVGRNAVEVLLSENNRNIVILERGDEAEALREAGHFVFDGDATQDSVLRQVGIERAWGVLVATGSDATNLFVVLSSRALNPDLTIVARSSSEENVSKMLRAGADRVVSPYDIGGKRMAYSLLRPHLTEFLDVLTTSSGDELLLEEVSVVDSSLLVGKTLRELELRQRTGITLLAVLREDGVVTPDADFRCVETDRLIVIGTRTQLDRLEEMLE